MVARAQPAPHLPRDQTNDRARGAFPTQGSGMKEVVSTGRCMSPA